jgi:hypothetical protein
MDHRFRQGLSGMSQGAANVQIDTLSAAKAFGR